MKTDVVFTALFGRYEDLNELDITQSSNTRYVCFTDDPALKSRTWEVVLVEHDPKLTASRQSRKIKMLGHRHFPTGSRSLYIDNNVKLKVDGSVVLDEWLQNSEISFMRHYSRKNLRNEFFICSAYGLDEQEVLLRQFKYYVKNYHQVLLQRPHWGGMIARLNTENTDRFMQTWWEQFNRFSRRDQLSINVSSVISGVPIFTISGENDSSIWHEWPIRSNRNTKMRDKHSESRFRKFRIILNAIYFGTRYFLPKKIYVGGTN